ncbi:uncharacterized protein BJ212DRAFT_1296393 [Suillus subaureus]|uniref:Uncharacterized protein n=1 Tax=Suillus subaureus TaxID=48587 RepID=A0A9P7EJS4_9AGAM|nr:uncharacterized protein BJ212DRAFT_1296393 [Suillus subaureus]KAG1823869.1 hypothetical protein BJ212DRAFT_1296393 [Suillus subaureus]
MNHCGHCRQNIGTLQVEAAPAPAPVSPTPVSPAPVPIAPAPAPVALMHVTPAAATTTAAAAIATALHHPRRQEDTSAAHLDNGEWIDMNNVSSSEDNNNPPEVMANTHIPPEVIANTHTHPSPLQTVTSTLHTNPFATRKRGVKTTANVLFFFRKNSDTGKHICIPCKDLNKIDSSCPLTVYGPSMSNTPLCSHESKKQQWLIGIHPVADRLDEGWTFTQMLE